MQCDGFFIINVFYIFCYRKQIQQDVHRLPIHPSKGDPYVPAGPCASQTSKYQQRSVHNSWRKNVINLRHQPCTEAAAAAGGWSWDLSHPEFALSEFGIRNSQLGYPEFGIRDSAIRHSQSGIRNSGIWFRDSESGFRRGGIRWSVFRNSVIRNSLSRNSVVRFLEIGRAPGWQGV